MAIKIAIGSISEIDIDYGNFTYSGDNRYWVIHPTGPNPGGGPTGIFGPGIDFRAGWDVDTSNALSGGILVPGGTVNITCPPDALPGTNALVLYQTVREGPGPFYGQWKYSATLFDVLCMVETITIGDAIWDPSTGKWDYQVTITAEGGTPPYTHTPSSPVTISLFPGDSYTLTTSTSDSGSCSDSNSTVIGPAPDAPPVAGPCSKQGASTSGNGSSCNSDQRCVVTSGNNIVSGDSGDPQSHGHYAGVGNSALSPSAK